MLIGECLDYRPKNEWWSYQWCYKDNIEQHHYERHPIVPSVINDVGEYKGEIRTDQQSWSQTYQHAESDCQAEGSDDDLIRRTATVNINCCLVDHSSTRKKRMKAADIKHGTFIERVEEASPCNYLLTVCSELTCTEEMKESVRVQMQRNAPKDVNYKAVKEPSQSKTQKGKLKEKANQEETWVSATTKPNFQYSFTAENNKPVTREEQEELKNRVKEMFYHGYNSYMDNAYPEVTLGSEFFLNLA